MVVTKNIDCKKPILFFCQGSLPRPIVINFPDNPWIAPLSNFNYNKLQKSYHIVIAAMPHIAAIANHTQLDDKHNYFVKPLWGRGHNFEIV